MTDPIHLLEDSFAKVKPNAMAFSHCFHRHLFAKHPDIEPMFGDLSLELMEKKTRRFPGPDCREFAQS